MIFEVGETVVYPHHGAATITAVKTRTIKGVDKKYITLQIHQSELVIDVPVDNAELVGLRDVIDSSGVEAVFDVLRGDVEEEAGNWSRRFKANTEKMGSGDVRRVSEVVRDLWRRDQDSGVSAGEKRMLAKARQILVSELALAQKSTDEEASVVLDGVLAQSISASPA
ncbi:CarD family transcriptional regulator [Clavibacter michiganensis subsp. insidiosus]|jgi:CarD family transcriptional regulator|uniref:RNA polymerase-binding transcription factor CarD n=14 Tax=Clavibacter TaxID=1573 RepID=A0A251YBB0_9MICO|nr:MULTISPECIES: CarD family transcriptional regulator [Clavibacter]OQJ60576.1 CarD family transcriptional regulator [Clavibacter michiganensis subsp. insidiosus]OUE21544.1 RNA polymerase-binding transcription factor CarD [Clavibacter michiganensis]OUE27161.1 RNA polymerase-binding transcription factor CarD [Clavibacter michiganensis]RII88262.1 CarD family transcriptional regulator [Clavibacter michiganensis subsp. insidiosus]RIJ37211.1 CarD family transcriptional regulator [Clavibacter michig